MKKISICVFLLLCAISCLAQQPDVPSSVFNYPTGTDIPSFMDGYVVYAQNDGKKLKSSGQKLPETFSGGVLIIEYQEQYWYQNQEYNKTFQAVYSNLEIDKKFLKATKKNPIAVYENEKLGTSKNNTFLSIRCEDVDPYLISCSDYFPLFYNGYWYYYTESLDPRIAKYLSFQLISSSKDLITFSDGISQTFKEIVKASSNEQLVTVPVWPVRFQTVLKSYPVPKHKLSNEEQTIHNQFLSNMTLESVIEIDGLKIHLYFPESYGKYFETEYKLGNPIYLIGNIIYSLKNELHLYARDFSITDPETRVAEKINMVLTSK